jgi:DUF4097 and DUF4098 domain-containing protein YvlB
MSDDVVVEYDQPQEPSKVKITLERTDDGALRCIAKALADSNSDPRMAMVLGGMFGSVGTIRTSGRVIINGVTITGQNLQEVKLNLLVNPSTQLRIINANAQNDSITLSKLVAGAIHARGINGNIKASLLEGNTSLRTTNGNINLDLNERCKTITASTTNGNIRVRQSKFLGSLSAGTTNGSISYDGDDVENPFYKTFDHYEGNSIDANTTNGSISFE